MFQNSLPGRTLLVGEHIFAAIRCRCAVLQPGASFLWYGFPYVLAGSNYLLTQVRPPLKGFGT